MMTPVVPRWMAALAMDFQGVRILRATAVALATAILPIYLSIFAFSVRMRWSANVH
jgi:hypothetical protein